jgi:hypothetical protein
VVKEPNNMKEALAFKVTSVAADGNEIAVYISAGLRRETVKSMNDEYGNVEVEEIDPAALPEGIIIED